MTQAAILVVWLIVVLVVGVGLCLFSAHLTGQKNQTNPPRPDGHVAYVCAPPCQLPYCQYCEGGLFACVRCGSAEGATTSVCPGRQMSQDELDRVYEGTLDYQRGAWVEACSPHSPAYHRTASPEAETEQLP